ncbi:hypothetical protein BSQ44_20840 [Aquibium oceanicum]|uniref:Uncharacterized protein n=1 Tax=Aquibium oceanicum TaxID=1670800 RepID=A0A1L3SW50_9HYPH|nr:hypothetical protein BSQ44_20840 [Aquibium oceanicum]
MMAIAVRDHRAVAEQGALLPEHRNHFWTTIDSYGQQEFCRPLRQHVEDASIVAFLDGRGFAVEAELNVKDARAEEVSSLVVSFEVLRDSGAGVHLHYAYW